MNKPHICKTELNRWVLSVCPCNYSKNTVVREWLKNLAYKRVKENERIKQNN